MKLLIDMGNSRLKSARYTNKKLSDFVSIPYGEKSSLACFKAYILEQSGLVSVTMVSVLGNGFQRSIRAFCQEVGIQLVWAASSERGQGVENKYLKPLSLGSDRFVALVGAKKLFPNQYCIVVDCGTAVTVDALTADGVFCGGVIIPGLQLWGDSLTSRANQLNAHQLDHPSVLARDTAQAIGSGSLFGLVGAIEGLCQRIEMQLKHDHAGDVDVVRLLCGGDAQIVAQHSHLTYVVEPHLVLMGLTEFSE